MQPNDIITLKAFLAALSQMEQPLPADIQTQLNEIGKTLATNLTNLDNLDALAKSYHPLKSIYIQERIALREDAAERSKGLPPCPLIHKPTEELINLAIDTFSADDSVAAIQKDTPAKNPLKRIWQSIRGSN
jgi:hypothetical protein